MRAAGSKGFFGFVRVAPILTLRLPNRAFPRSAWERTSGHAPRGGHGGPSRGAAGEGRSHAARGNEGRVGFAMHPSTLLDVRPEPAEAVRAGRPVVALESALAR